jgi:sporulation protein YlmC with PRC-barrel domain
MSENIEYRIGSEVFCSDGPGGELRRVVVDPIAVTLTHLVVEAPHRQGSGHLVPLELVESVEDDVIQLRCSTAELGALEPAEDVRFLVGASGPWGYGQDQMLSLPYYGLAGGGMGLAPGMPITPQALVSDRVPTGEVEVRRGDRVQAKDGPIGRVQGLVIDPADRHVTHVLLEEGHLWGKKQVAIPIGSIRRIEDELHLTLTKDEVRDLPPVELSGH